MAETHFDALHIGTTSTFDGPVTVTGALTATGGVSGAMTSTGNITASGGTITIGTMVWTYGTSTPSAGNWYIGNIIWNSNPASAGGTPGWMCVSPGAGTASTWRRFGTMWPNT